MTQINARSRCTLLAAAAALTLVVSCELLSLIGTAHAAQRYTLCDGNVLGDSGPGDTITVSVRGGVRCQDAGRVAKSWIARCNHGSEGPRNCTVLKYRCRYERPVNTVGCSKGKRQLRFNLLD